MKKTAIIRAVGMNVFVSYDEIKLSESEVIGMLLNAGGQYESGCFYFNKNDFMLDVMNVFWNMGAEDIDFVRRED